MAGGRGRFGRMCTGTWAQINVPVFGLCDKQTKCIAAAYSRLSMSLSSESLICIQVGSLS